MSYSIEHRFEPKNLALPNFWRKGVELLTSTGTAALSGPGADSTWFRSVYIPTVGAVFGLTPVMASALDKEFADKLIAA